MQMAAVAIITGLLWWQRGRGRTLAAGNDILGLLFFELLFPSFRWGEVTVLRVAYHCGVALSQDDMTKYEGMI